jgi:ethanolamine utilization protein EutQ (cupin superfamily)
MQQPSKPAERILCLIEGYPSAFGGDGEVKADHAHQKWVRKMMSEQPGRWFLVGEVVYVNRVRKRLGREPVELRKLGFEAEQVSHKVYARAPHPDGVPLSDLVTRAEPRTRSDALPEVADVRFGWTADEMSNAIATARAWLFPTKGIAA